MQNKLGYFILLSGAIFSNIAFAESTSDSLTRIEAETLVLKAREKQLDVQAKIIARQNEIAAKQADTDRLTQNAVIGDPVVRSIEKIGSSTFATLELSNGSMIDTQVGDILSNGMKVISIKANEVIVETRKKRRTRLSAASNAPAAFNPNYPGTGLNLPPFLPMPATRGSIK